MKPNQMQDLMKQLTKARKSMDRVNEELKDRYLEAEIGGGAIEATFNGQQELVKIRFDADKLEKADDGSIDLDLLEDMIVAVVNQGIEKSKALAEEEMNEATGGLSGGIPGLF